MDPNETLRQIRDEVQAIRACSEDTPANREAVASHAFDLAERVKALDSWLSQGGFPPEAWREGPDVPAEHIYVPAPERDGDRCADCGQPRDGNADRHCVATSTEWDRTYHRWVSEV